MTMTDVQLFPKSDEAVSLRNGNLEISALNLSPVSRAYLNQKRHFDPVSYMKFYSSITLSLKNWP